MSEEVKRKKAGWSMGEKEGFGVGRKRIKLEKRAKRRNSTRRGSRNHCGNAGEERRARIRLGRVDSRAEIRE